MVEYLYNCIRATAGQDATIIANIAENGEDITAGMTMMLHDADKAMIINVDGVYADGLWHFTIPADATKGRQGKHWYCLQRDGINVCFHEPIYLV